MVDYLIMAADLINFRIGALPVASGCVISAAGSPVVLTLAILILALMHRSNKILPWEFTHSSLTAKGPLHQYCPLGGQNHSQYSPSVFLYMHSYLHISRHFLLVNNSLSKASWCKPSLLL